MGNISSQSDHVSSELRTLNFEVETDARRKVLSAETEARTKQIAAETTKAIAVAKQEEEKVKQEVEKAKQEAEKAKQEAEKRIEIVQHAANSKKISYIISSSLAVLGVGLLGLAADYMYNGSARVIRWRVHRALTNGRFKRNLKLKPLVPFKHHQEKLIPEFLPFCWDPVGVENLLC